MFAEITNPPNGWTVRTSEDAETGRLVFMPEGATAEDAIALVLADDPPLTEAEQAAAAERRTAAAIDAHVEQRAQALGYNSAAHLATYVTSGVAGWKAEADAFVAWRDGVWVAALTMLTVAQDAGTVPEIEDVIAALPEWTGP